MPLRARIRRWYRSVREDDAFFALQIALAYLSVGVVWILASDRLLDLLVQDPGRLSWLQTFKGWAFVVGTSGLLYLLLWISLRARRKLRRRQRESDRFLETLTHNLPGVVYSCRNDEHWTMTYLSSGVAELTGYEAEALIGNRERSYASLIHEADRDRVRAEVESSLERRRPFRLEYRIRTLGGEVRWVWEQGRGVYDDEGRLLKLEGFLTDVTDRRRARDELHRQMERLRALRAIDVAIMGSLDLGLTLDVVLDQVTTHLGVDAAAVLTFDPASERLEYAAGRGFRTDALRHTRLRLGEGHAGRAALEREAVHVPDLRREPGDFVWSWLIPDERFVAYRALPLVSKGQLRGVLEVFHRSPHRPDEAWLEFLEALAGQTAIAIDNAGLVEDLERANLELRVAYDRTIEGWARALDLRDDETEGHSRRVAELTVALAERMDVRGEDLLHIRRGALLHDIGKLAIPDRILLKPGPLTDEETEVMRRHTTHAHTLLSSISFLRPALAIPDCHHEKWDGSGYPHGLRGEEIPLAARIFAVADVWDALTSDRPYRDAWPEAKARKHIREEAGGHFDPAVVEAFLTIDPAELERITNASRPEPAAAASSSARATTAAAPEGRGRSGRRDPEAEPPPG